MHVSKKKVELVLIRQCKSLRDLRSGISPGTLAKVRNGDELRPKTVGRLAQLLGCDPADILNDETPEDVAGYGARTS